MIFFGKATLLGKSYRYGNDAGTAPYVGMKVFQKGECKSLDTVCKRVAEQLKCRNPSHYVLDLSPNFRINIDYIRGKPVCVLSIGLCSWFLLDDMLRNVIIAHELAHICGSTVGVSPNLDFDQMSVCKHFASSGIKGERLTKACHESFCDSVAKFIADNISVAQTMVRTFLVSELYPDSAYPLIYNRNDVNNIARIELVKMIYERMASLLKSYDISALDTHLLNCDPELYQRLFFMKKDIGTGFFQSERETLLNLLNSFDANDSNLSVLSDWIYPTD